MLGEKIGSERGKVTSRRIIPGDDKMSFIKMEITVEMETTVYGVSGMNIGTYVVYERGPGQMFGEGQGIIMTNDGDGIIWQGVGVGRGEEDGSIAMAASIVCQTTSEKLAKLNHLLVLVEQKADMAGSASSELYEWKA